MDRPRRLRLICSTLAFTCLTISVWVGLFIPLPAIAPDWAGVKFSCVFDGSRDCHVKSKDILDLVPNSATIAEDQKGAARERLVAGLRQPLIRVTLMLGYAFLLGPLILGFWALFRLFRIYGAGTPFAAAAIAQLRRISTMLVIGTVIYPPSKALIDSIYATAAEPKNWKIVFEIDVNTLLGGLFLAAIIWVICWAMDEGHKLQVEASEII